MTDWYRKSINALALNGKAERTQQAYTRALRMLVDFYGKRPEQIGENELASDGVHPNRHRPKKGLCIIPERC